MNIEIVIFGIFRESKWQIHLPAENIFQRLPTVRGCVVEAG